MQRSLISSQFSHVSQVPSKQKMGMCFKVRAKFNFGIINSKPAFLSKISNEQSFSLSVFSYPFLFGHSKRSSHQLLLLLFATAFRTEAQCFTWAPPSADIQLFLLNPQPFLASTANLESLLGKRRKTATGNSVFWAQIYFLICQITCISRLQQPCQNARHSSGLLTLLNSSSFPLVSSFHPVMWVFCLVFHQSYSQQLWGRATQMKNNDRENTSVSDSRALPFTPTIQATQLLKTVILPNILYSLILRPTPYSSCRCAIAILAILLLLKPARCTESFHKPLFCPIPLSAAANPAALVLPFPIIFSLLHDLGLSFYIPPLFFKDNLKV